MPNKIADSNDREGPKQAVTETDSDLAAERESILRSMPWHYVLMSLCIGVITFLCSCGMAAAGMAIFAVAQNLVVMLVGFAIHSIGNSWFVPNVMTSLGGKLKHHQQARAAGLLKAGQFLSTPIVAVIVEPYPEQFGAVTVMLMAGALSACVFILMVGRMIALGKASPTVDPVAMTGH